MEVSYLLLFALVASRPKLFDKTGIKFDITFFDEVEKFKENTSNDVPTISKVKLDKSSSYMLTDVTPCGRTIVNLLFNKETRVKEKSYLFVSNDTGSTFKEYSKSDFDDMFEIDDFTIDDRFIYLISYRKNKIYIFDHLFNLLTKTQTQSETGSFYIHPLLQSLQANLAIDNRLYVTSNSGKSWSYRGSDIMNFTWVYDNSGNFLVVTKAKTSDLFLQNSAKENFSATMKQDALKIIQAGNKSFTIYKEKGKYVVGMLTKYNNMQKLYIPTKFDIMDFSVNHIFGSEYMVMSTLSDGTTNLYQGNLITYKFVRVLDKVKSLYSDSYGRCYDVAYFEKIPGFILANAYGFEGFNDESTLISFNHGGKWQRVKVGIYEDGKPASECHLPACSFKLHFDCTFNSHLKHNFQQSDLAPYILASKADYKINDKSYSGIFVSTDAGYSWHLSLKGNSYPGMINEGGILLGVPRITYSVYYSLNEGKNWSFLRSDWGSYIINEIGESIYSRTKFLLLGASYSNWYIYTIDFSKLLSKECLTDDYTYFRPSSSGTTHCFMGYKYALYRKNPDSVCKNTLEKMPPIYGGMCPCSQDDFGCNYGHKMVNGLCIEDPEAEVTTAPWKYCWPGGWITTPSAYASIAYDKCDKKNYNIGYKYTICGLTKYNDFIAFIKGVRIGYFELYKGELREVVLPNSLYYPKTAGSFTMDVGTGCIYYLTSKVIVRKSCWTDAGYDLQPSDTVYLSEQSVTYLDFDPVGFNLVYSSMDELNIKSVRSGRTKIISTEYTSDISFIRVVSEEGYILVGQHKMNRINKLFFNGTLIDSYNFTDPLIVAAYDNTQKKLYGLTNKGLNLINGKSILLTKITVPLGTSDVKFFAGNPVFVTDKGVFYITKFYSLKSVGEIFVKNSSTYWSNPCESVICGDICVPTSNASAECLCPNNMELVGTSCKCKKSNPNCQKCKDNEFTCDEGECISSLKRCDGYTDCKNGADEYNCKIKCTSDEFSCPSEAKCIPVTMVCDGLIDCVGAEDEIGCKPVTNCTSKEFTCANKICIPIEKRCDSKNDCGDNSDEEKCEGSQCSAQEFKCNDGSCIPKAAVCNNNMDCSNWEDEEGCHAIREHNKTCFFKCSNNKCIPKEKVCDRVADCSDGFDEMICGYPTECLTGTVACKYTRECVLESELCDGKYDCSDYTDETNCKKREYPCNPGFSFQCSKSKECIPIGYYCDYLVDCADGSDEINDCYKLPKVTYITSYMININTFNVSWNTRKTPSNVTYKFSMFDDMKSPALFTRKITGRYVLVKDLLFCITYYIKVEIDSSHNTGAVKSIKARPSSLPAVKDALYAGKIVKWQPYNLYCVSQIYSIQCKNGNEVKYKNFTMFTFQSVGSYGSCNVRICPFKAFGPFCSPSTQARATNSAGTIAGIVIGSLILIAVVIAGVYLLYRRYGQRFHESYNRIKNHNPTAKVEHHGSELSDDEIEI